MPFLGLKLLAAKGPSVENPQPSQAIPPPAVSQAADAEQEELVTLEPTPEQIRYAGVLEKGARLGLLCLFVSFPLYVFGVVSPYVPPERVRECWTLDAHEYLAQTGIEPGWSWVSKLGHGDFLNFVGVIVLASVTIFCYLAIVPLMLRRKDNIYAVLALLEVVVLILAAAGVFSVGH